MQKRSVAAVIILTIITFGIYALVWLVKTKGEMVRQGADIPTAWLLIVPIVSIYWTWKWCGGVEKVTNGKLSQVISLILMLLLGVIGMAIVQDAFNKSAAGELPQARVA
jgi:hypothetical protein